MSLKRKAQIGKNCVACGTCVFECPVQAITIYKGTCAQVQDNCVGCGRCAQACPAGIITIQEVGGEQ